MSQTEARQRVISPESLAKLPEGRHTKTAQALAWALGMCIGAHQAAFSSSAPLHGHKIVGGFTSSRAEANFKASCCRETGQAGAFKPRLRVCAGEAGSPSSVCDIRIPPRGNIAQELEA